MIPRADLPEDASEWQSVHVHFDRLDEDSRRSATRKCEKAHTTAISDSFVAKP